MMKIALEAQVRTFSVQRSRSQNAYVNFTFESPTIANTWRLVHARALGHPKMGPTLCDASIVVCQGSRGWDNYRLLHHFDRRKQLDSLAGIEQARCA
jgi:hypothetical protein